MSSALIIEIIPWRSCRTRAAANRRGGAGAAVAAQIRHAADPAAGRPAPGPVTGAVDCPRLAAAVVSQHALCAPRWPRRTAGRASAAPRIVLVVGWPRPAWLKRLLELKDIESLDRDIVVEMISEIRVYENRKIKITYNFGNELEHLFSSVYSVESEEKVI